jgi:glutathione S-transferase
MKHGIILTCLVLEKSAYLAGDSLSAADITFAALVSVQGPLLALPSRLNPDLVIRRSRHHA